MQQQWMRASKKKSGIVGHFGPLRRAPAESKSLCGWRSFVNGRAYDYQRKRKIQLWWRVTSLSHTRFTMSHTTQTQTRPLTLTSPLFLTFDKMQKYWVLNTSWPSYKHKGVVARAGVRGWGLEFTCVGLRSLTVSNITLVQQAVSGFFFLDTFFFFFAFFVNGKKITPKIKYKNWHNN